MMTEDQLEQEALSWLAETGYKHLCGYDIAPDGIAPERENFGQVLLVERLRRSVTKLNPAIPAVAREDAVRQVLDLGIPALLSANQRFHQLLVTGVPVQYQKDGETRGDFARLNEYFPDTWGDIENIMQSTILTANELAMVRAFREVTGDSDAVPVVINRDAVLAIVVA